MRLNKLVQLCKNTINFVSRKLLKYTNTEKTSAPAMENFDFHGQWKKKLQISKILVCSANSRRHTVRTQTMGSSDIFLLRLNGGVTSIHEEQMLPFDKSIFL
mmetsp:Transcript_3931/g.6977  ORF Transcript_3931/g.6977 Transcript_3931/m.6977 type:complete len:102 (-) Transcript_3931:1481-1786(-)